MENDDQKNTNLIIEDYNSSTSVFKLEYQDQNVNENIGYQKWKKLMLKEYGNNSKQFKCNKDKILFYSAYNDCLNKDNYKCKCPICNKYICYFCSFNGNNTLTKCCIKGNIFRPIFYYGPNFIGESFEKISLFILFPFINIYSIVFFFFNAFYLNIIKEQSKNNNNEVIYYVDLDKNKKYILNAIFISSIGFSICIPYIIICSYFIILLIIISIPFKFAPLQYYLGIIYLECKLKFNY